MQGCNNRLRPPTARRLFVPVVFLFLFFIPSQDIQKLSVKVGVPKKITTFLHQPRGVNEVLGKEINKLEELVVYVSIGHEKLDTVEEMSVIVHIHASWLGKNGMV